MAAQFTKLTEEVAETVMEGCDALLRVSAGMQSILTLLDLEEESADALGLHCLLAPLKARLDQAINLIQKSF
ncbi:DUF1484 family protein [Cupriavidus sp. TMH.W2]|uniref:DUF1484 family protein n=1 Tax=Cupriavidus sp. TMH.W2 TaxID=3434465 RepID=UPI003D77F768